MRLQITVAFTLILLIASAFISLTQIHNIHTQIPEKTQASMQP